VHFRELVQTEVITPSGRPIAHIAAYIGVTRQALSNLLNAMRSFGGDGLALVTGRVPRYVEVERDTSDGSFLSQRTGARPDYVFGRVRLIKAVASGRGTHQQ